MRYTQETENTLIGKKFNKLTILENIRKVVGNSKKEKVFVRCKCDCGKEVVVVRGRVLTGYTKSCGCLKKGRITHKLSSCDEYNILRGMHQRCKNPNNSAYDRYGGRGIDVCNRWDTGDLGESVKNFIEDIGYRPSKQHSVERKDNNKGYCKENCFWATFKTQANNKRNNRIIRYKGEEKTLSEWCDILDIKYSTVEDRLLSGWPPERAFLKIITKGRKSVIAIDIFTPRNIIFSSVQKLRKEFCSSPDIYLGKDKLYKNRFRIEYLY